MGERQPVAAMCCELFKLLRDKAMTRRQIEVELGWANVTVTKWVAELHANGFLVASVGVRRGHTKGKLPVVFALSSEWGGKSA